MQQIIKDLVQFTFPERMARVEELNFLQLCQVFGQITEDTSTDTPLRGHDFWHAARTGRLPTDFFAPPAQFTHRARSGKLNSFWNVSVLIASDSTLNFDRMNKKSYKTQVQQALYEEVHGVKEITSSGATLADLRGMLIDHVFTKEDPFQYHDTKQDFKVVFVVWNFNDTASNKHGVWGMAGHPTENNPRTTLNLLRAARNQAEAFIDDCVRNLPKGWIHIAIVGGNHTSWCKDLQGAHEFWSIEAHKMREIMRARTSEWQKHGIFPRVLVLDGVALLAKFVKRDPWHARLPEAEAPELKPFQHHLRDHFLAMSRFACTVFSQPAGGAKFRPPSARPVPGSEPAAGSSAPGVGNTAITVTHAPDLSEYCANFRTWRPWYRHLFPAGGREPSSALSPCPLPHAAVDGFPKEISAFKVATHEDYKRWSSAHADEAVTAELTGFSRHRLPTIPRSTQDQMGAALPWMPGMTQIGFPEPPNGHHPIDSFQTPILEDLRAVLQGTSTTMRFVPGQAQRTYPRSGAAAAAPVDDTPASSTDRPTNATDELPHRTAFREAMARILKGEKFWHSAAGAMWVITNNVHSVQWRPAMEWQKTFVSNGVSFLCPDLTSAWLCQPYSDTNRRPGLDLDTAMAIANGNKQSEQHINLDKTPNSGGAMRTASNTAWFRDTIYGSQYPGPTLSYCALCWIHKLMLRPSCADPMISLASTVEWDSVSVTYHPEYHGVARFRMPLKGRGPIIRDLLTKGFLSFSHGTPTICLESILESGMLIPSDPKHGGGIKTAGGSGVYCHVVTGPRDHKEYTVAVEVFNDGIFWTTDIVFIAPPDDAWNPQNAGTVHSVRGRNTLQQHVAANAGQCIISHVDLYAWTPAQLHSASVHILDSRDRRNWQQWEPRASLAYSTRDDLQEARRFQSERYLRGVMSPEFPLTPGPAVMAPPADVYQYAHQTLRVQGLKRHLLFPQTQYSITNLELEDLISFEDIISTSLQGPPTVGSSAPDVGTTDTGTTGTGTSGSPLTETSTQQAAPADPAAPAAELVPPGTDPLPAASAPMEVDPFQPMVPPNPGADVPAVPLPKVGGASGTPPPTHPPPHGIPKAPPAGIRSGPIPAGTTAPAGATDRGWGKSSSDSSSDTTSSSSSDDDPQASLHALRRQVLAFLPDKLDSSKKNIPGLTIWIQQVEDRELLEKILTEFQQFANNYKFADKASQRDMKKQLRHVILVNMAEYPASAPALSGAASSSAGPTGPGVPPRADSPDGPGPKEASPLIAPGAAASPSPESEQTRRAQDKQALNELNARDWDPASDPAGSSAAELVPSGTGLLLESPQDTTSTQPPVAAAAPPAEAPPVIPVLAPIVEADKATDALLSPTLQTEVLYFQRHAPPEEPDTPERSRQEQSLLGVHLPDHQRIFGNIAFFGPFHAQSKDYRGLQSVPAAYTTTPCWIQEQLEDALHGGCLTPTTLAIRATLDRALVSDQLIDHDPVFKVLSSLSNGDQDAARSYLMMVHGSLEPVNIPVGLCALTLKTPMPCTVSDPIDWSAKSRHTQQTVLRVAALIKWLLRHSADLITNSGGWLPLSALAFHVSCAHYTDPLALTMAAIATLSSQEYDMLGVPAGTTVDATFIDTHLKIWWRDAWQFTLPHDIPFFIRASDGHSIAVVRLSRVYPRYDYSVMRFFHGPLLFPCDARCFIDAQRGELHPPKDGINKARDIRVKRVLPVNHSPDLGPSSDGRPQDLPSWLVTQDEAEVDPATRQAQLNAIQTTGNFTYVDIHKLWPQHSHSQSDWTHVLVLSPMAIKTREWFLARDGTLITEMVIPWMEIQVGLWLLWQHNPTDAVHWTKFFDCAFQNVMIDYNVLTVLGQLEQSVRLEADPHSMIAVERSPEENASLAQRFPSWPHGATLICAQLHHCRPCTLICLECSGTRAFHYTRPLQLNRHQPNSAAEKGRMVWGQRALRLQPRLPQELIGPKGDSSDMEKKRRQVQIRSRFAARWTIRTPDHNPEDWDWCVRLAKKGCTSLLHRPGHGPPWDFATQLSPTPDVPYFRAFQLISKRATSCWHFYKDRLRQQHFVPRYILDQINDRLLFQEGFGMEEWYPAWFRTIDLAAQPRDYGALQCFNFEAHKIATNEDRTEPAAGWLALSYDIVLPGSLVSAPQLTPPDPPPLVFGDIGPEELERAFPDEEIDTAVLNRLREQTAIRPATQLQLTGSPRFLMDVSNDAVLPNIRELQALHLRVADAHFRVPDFNGRYLDYVTTPPGWTLQSWCLQHLPQTPSNRPDHNAAAFKASLIDACVRIIDPWFSQANFQYPKRWVVRALYAIEDPRRKSQVSELSRLAHVVLKCVLRWLALDLNHVVDSIRTLTDPTHFIGKDLLTVSVQDGIWSMQMLELAISDIPETLRHEIRRDADPIARCVCILGPTFSLQFPVDARRYRACCEATTEAWTKVACAVISRARREHPLVALPHDGVQVAQQPAAAPQAHENVQVAQQPAAAPLAHESVQVAQQPAAYPQPHGSVQVAQQPAAASPAHEDEQAAQQPAAPPNPTTPPAMQELAVIRNRYSAAAAKAAPSPADVDEVAGEGATHGESPRPRSPAPLLFPPLPPAPQWRPALAAPPRLPPPPPAPRAAEEVLPAPVAGPQERPAKAPRLDQAPDKGNGKNQGKDKNTDKSFDKGKSKGTGKDKGRNKGDTQKSDGYGKSPIGMGKQSYKAEPYDRRQRTLVQNGVELIPWNDEGDWAYNSQTRCRQYWSSQYQNWIYGTWEE